MTRTPFHNKQGKIVINLKPLRDVCLIYILPPPNKMGDSQTILIPEQFKDRHYKPEGVILAVGPGYYGKDGIFREVSKDLKPGVKVTFDMNVPWRQNVEAADGKLYTVVMCTELDISCIVEEK